MTQNQIAYQQLQESKRHNEATEGIQRRNVNNQIAGTAIGGFGNILGSAIKALPIFLSGGKK